MILHFGSTPAASVVARELAWTAVVMVKPGTADRGLAEALLVEATPEHAAADWAALAARKGGAR